MINTTATTTTSASHASRDIPFNQSCEEALRGGDVSDDCPSAPSRDVFRAATQFMREFSDDDDTCLSTAVTSLVDNVTSVLAGKGPQCSNVSNIAIINNTLFTINKVGRSFAETMVSTNI